MLSKLLNFLKNFDSQLKMGPISVVSPISKKISTFLAALFKQLLDFRIYLFLKIFAKSINKLTRGDYVSEVQLPKLDPIPKLGEMTVHMYVLIPGAPLYLCLPGMWRRRMFILSASVYLYLSMSAV